jgi:hypothetical protein
MQMEISKMIIDHASTLITDAKKKDRESGTIRRSRMFAFFLFLLILSNVARSVDEKK